MGKKHNSSTFNLCFAVCSAAAQAWRPWKKAFLEGASRENPQREKHPSRSSSETICLMYVVYVFLIYSSRFSTVRIQPAVLPTSYFYSKVGKGLPEEITADIHLSPSLLKVSDVQYMLNMMIEKVQSKLLISL